MRELGEKSPPHSLRSPQRLCPFTSPSPTPSRQGRRRVAPNPHYFFTEGARQTTDGPPGPWVSGLSLELPREARRCIDQRGASQAFRLVGSLLTRSREGVLPTSVSLNRRLPCSAKAELPARHCTEALA